MSSIAISNRPQTAEKLRAVVFDLDGVLIHSAPCHRAAFVQVLDEFGIKDFEYSRFAGWRTRDVIECVLAEANVTASADVIAAASAEKSRLARDMMASAQPIADGCTEVLQQLYDNGLVLALASSGSAESVGAFLQATGTRRFFRSVLTGGDVRNAKPDPEIYSQTFAAIEMKGSDCLVVEDAVAGVKAALGAGSSAIGIAGTCSLQDLLDAGALDVLGRLRDLPAWIESNGRNK